MGLFDIFTGDPVKKAAEQQQQYLTGISNQIQSGIGAAQTRGIDALQSGQGSAIGALQGGQATARRRVDPGPSPPSRTPSPPTT